MAGGSHDKPIAVYGAMVANFIIAVAKFVAAGFTGSSAMISEGIHSLVDTGNQGLLLLGLRRARQPADELHPFGHGKELYFWGLIVAIILFGLGGGMSVYEGIQHIQHPVVEGGATAQTWNYGVLGVAIVVEGISFYIAANEFRKRLGVRKVGVWEGLRHSKDPALFVVLLEDTAAMLGLIIALAGVFLADVLEAPVIDGVASLLIGILLGIVALFLASETRGLLVGESAELSTVLAIEEIARADPGIVSVKRPLTMHFGPNDVLLNIAVEFREGMTGAEVVETVDRLEENIQKRFPAIRHIFIEADSLREAAPVDSAVAVRQDGFPTAGSPP
ncbi:MAG: cation diffusion facilitator family transporter [Anaerolineae bacterium]|nr:cation diffusion facilitator family transporter [Anaerolineae bacterium]